VIENSIVGDGTEILKSVILDSSIGNDTHIGPFSYLRPGSSVGDGCKVGDFVELKNSVLGDGSKAAHLAYVGDADIGRNVNIGCGVIFANYDGKNKHRTEVEDTKEETNNSSFVKEDAVIEAEDNLNEKNLPVDVIEEPTSEENEAIFDSEEKPSELEENKEEKQEVAIEVDAKVDSIVESKVDAIVEPKSEEETIEVEVKSVQSVPNTSEEREESSNENNIEKKELPNSSEPTHILEDEDTDVESSENGILKKVALVAFIVIICLGIFLWARMSSTNSEKKTKEVAEQVNTSEDHSSLGTQTVSADTTSVTKVHKTPEKKETAKVDSFIALNKSYPGPLHHLPSEAVEFPNGIA